MTGLRKVVGKQQLNEACPDTNPALSRISIALINSDSVCPLSSKLWFQGCPSLKARYLIVLQSGQSKKITEVILQVLKCTAKDLLFSSPVDVAPLLRPGHAWPYRGLACPTCVYVCVCVCVCVRVSARVFEMGVPVCSTSPHHRLLAQPSCLPVAQAGCISIHLTLNDSPYSRCKNGCCKLPSLHKTLM